MVKLFLVEDEAIIRDGIKKHIDWEAEGIEFVGEAGDGEMALPLIAEELDLDDAICFILGWGHGSLICGTTGITVDEKNPSDYIKQM